jgi:hypothetical protein
VAREQAGMLAKHFAAPDFAGVLPVVLSRHALVDQHDVYHAQQKSPGLSSRAA